MKNKFEICEEAQYYINKGFIDINDKVEFKTINKNIQ